MRPGPPPLLAGVDFHREENNRQGIEMVSRGCSHHLGGLWERSVNAFIRPRFRLIATWQPTLERSMMQRTTGNLACSVLEAWKG